MEILTPLLALLALAIAAARWGVDSRDDLNSAEWSRRRGWSGFGR